MLNQAESCSCFGHTNTTDCDHRLSDLRTTTSFDGRIAFLQLFAEQRWSKLPTTCWRKIFVGQFAMAGPKKY